MTLDAYLAFEAASVIRHEFHAEPRLATRGEVLAMSGASEPHCVVVTNLTRLVGNALHGSDCRPMNNDMRVFCPGNAESGDRFVYPDLSVRCGTPRFLGDDKTGDDKTGDDDTGAARAPAKRTTLLNPRAIFEVLSPSTERCDRFDKFNAYARIEGMDANVLVHQDLPRVEVFTRQADGSWRVEPFSGPPAGRDDVATLRLPALHLHLHLHLALPLAELFDGIDLQTSVPSEDAPS